VEPLPHLYDWGMWLVLAAMAGVSALVGVIAEALIRRARERRLEK
jgi:hypothetical protein